MSQYADQIGFAAGALVGFRTDTTGVTPVRFGILQDVQVDFTTDLKELYGQYRYSIALAPGKTKIEFKAKFAKVSGRLFNDFYFGATTGTTRILFADNEPGTVPATPTYKITAANAASFKLDQGVINATTGQPLKRVTSPSASGEYGVDETIGVYSFASSDASAPMYISYTYTAVSGVQIPLANIRMGVGPLFRVVLNQPFDGRAVTYTFNNCQSSKLSYATKQDDFTIPEIDFMVSADSAGNIGTINYDL